MILLVVLGLLTIMALTMLTFVLVAAQAKRTAKATAPVERRGDPPRVVLHEALLQVLRGTDNDLSVLKPHSLLEDMYGSDGIVGRIPIDDASFSANPFDGIVHDPNFQIQVPNGATPLDVAVTAPNQATFLKIVVLRVQRGLDGAPGVAGFDDDGDMTIDEVDGSEDGLSGSDDVTLSDIDGFYNGRLFTMVDGPAAGQTTRIVGFQAASTSSHQISIFTLLPFKSMQASGPNATGDYSWLSRGAPRPGDRFVINGRPFNGTGFGLNLNPTAGQPLLNAADASNREFALLPNPVFHPRWNDPNLNQNYTYWRGAALPADPAGPGGADEGYDAVDYQNMLLGMRNVRVSGGAVVVDVIPSLHRPELANHWLERVAPASGSWQDIGNDIAHKACLRPDATTGGDHEFFTGSNASVMSGTPFDPINGPWDVDNDGDGVADSIWVDLGFPVQTAPDGRKYKPMFGIMCLDMDGKLNLNAHGSVTQLAYNDTINLFGTNSPATPGETTVLGPYTGGAAGTPTPLFMGQGYGPAEVNLVWLFKDATLTGDYARLLWGNASLRLPGRYGEVTRTFTALGTLPLGARSQSPAPGLTFFDGLAFNPTAAGSFNPDWESLVRHFDVPGLALLTPTVSTPPYLNPFYDQFATPSAYGTPPDLNGNGAVGLDLRGVPYWPTGASVPSAERNGMGERAERDSSPYRLDLSWESRQRGHYETVGKSYMSIDEPFTPEELERLLRYTDLDASSLPDRLLQLAPNTLAGITAQAQWARNLVTTESWDLPSPNMSAVPADILEGSPTIPLTQVVQTLARGVNVVDVLRARLEEEDFDTTNTANLNNAIRTLLPPELVAGLRYDINRPLGNGIDDGDKTDNDMDGEVDEADERFAAMSPDMVLNGVIDEPGEAATGMETYAANVFSAFPTGVPFDHNNDGRLGAFDANGNMQIELEEDDSAVRQVVARQLYCLMWLLIDPDYVTRVQTAGNFASAAEARREVARQIAQWAVNVVDFRDRDSIMTPFEYDVNPFDDSDMDGDPWDVDDVIAQSSTDNNAAHRGLVWGTERPELLITETLAFHDTRTENLDNDDGGKGKYDDDPMTDSDDDFDQRYEPVGSLFVELYNPGSPFDAPSGEFHSATDYGIELDRTSATGGSPVWRLMIAKPDGGVYKDPDDPVDPMDEDDYERSVYFTTSDPTAITDGTERYYMDLMAPVPQTLQPGRYAVVGSAPSTATASTDVGRKTMADYPLNIQLSPSVDITDASATSVLPSTATDIQIPMGVAINQPRRLSVSEPLNGYTPAPNVAATATTAASHSPPLDQPLDLKHANDTTLNDDGQFDALKAYGTHEQFRTIYLQRLANPLLPWNPLPGRMGHDATKDVNPYLTVDAMPIDLTVYNGDEDWMGGADPPFGEIAYNFDSRQRGAGALNNVWLPASAAPASGTETAPLPDQTLGYLNKDYAPYLTTTTATPMVSGTATVNGAAVNAAYYRGSPSVPFPWFTWNNRPFVSQYELLQVPAERSSRLLAAHSTLQATDNAYQPANDATQAPWFKDYPFRHLPNFFFADDTSGMGQAAPHFYRLFEYVHVPSRFAGTEEILNPVAVTGVGDGPHPFHPPFNRVSRYREPGKININTIFDESVWEGIRSNHPALPTFADLVDSRRGYTGTNGDMLAPSTAMGADTVPSFFSNPFRSMTANEFVPRAAWQRSREIDTTLLRATEADPTKPLFASPTTATAATNPNQNPYFRYLGLQKLGNTVTTRSNVYAVWITVGYFQVSETGMGSARHPDGFQLGAELGIETGEIRRHRAFYLIDRSIPVGFQRGYDLNVENCILLKRFIE